MKIPKTDNTTATLYTTPYFKAFEGFLGGLFKKVPLSAPSLYTYPHSGAHAARAAVCINTHRIQLTHVADG